ncbi:MAG: isochorismatase family protein [Phycisphaerae bacterium]
MTADPFFQRSELLRPVAAQLLIVDVQGRLVPHIDGHESVVAQCVRATRAAGVLAIPVTVSEQYPAGLGPTDPRILEAATGAGAGRVEKMTFSTAQEPHCWKRLYELQRPQILMVGIETHVCVQQTALDLKARGLAPIILADACGSRRAYDREIALQRMRAAGIIVTTVESAIYELMHRAGTEQFKRMLPIVK